MTVDFLAELPGIGIHQKRKLFELRNEYTLVDQTGITIGTATQERQGIIALLARLGSDLDVALPSTIVVRDGSQAAVLEVHKPWFTSTVTVRTPDGQTLGTIRWKIRLGKRRFNLLGAGGEQLGEVQAQNWRARDFLVVDAQGNQVANVTKKWRGLFTEGFTDADSYAVEFMPGLADPLRGLAFASALAVDLVMKQKDTG